MLLSKSCWKTTPIVLIVLLPLVLGLDTHGAVLYEQYGSQGMNIEITGNTPQLSVLGFDNRANSACILGVWLFYAYNEYNLGDRWGMHWAETGSTTTPFCFDLTDIGGFVSSVRYAGSPNGITVDTFNLYEFTWFKGYEEYITGSQPSLNLTERHASIIITGMGNWTVFEEANYTGPNHCLIPVTTVTIITDISELGIQDGSIRSVRKGCDANPNVVVRLPPSPMSGSSGSFTPISNLEKV